MKNCGFWKCFGMVVAQVHEMAEKSLNVDIILILAAQVLQSQVLCCLHDFFQDYTKLHGKWERKISFHHFIVRCSYIWELKQKY